MFSNGSAKRWFILAVGALAAGGVLAGGVIAAQFQGLEDPARLESALKDEPVVRVADIGSVGNLPGHGVFVQHTSTGQLCLWDAPSASSLARQGGCNSADDPLGGQKLSASLSYDGGPAPSQVTDARLIGLVALDVDTVRVLMGDGTRRDVPMKHTVAVASAAGSYRAFGYRFKPFDLQRGIGPTAVLALDSRGQEIDRQPTGFAG